VSRSAEYDDSRIGCHDVRKTRPPLFAESTPHR
jgi:hypothetical protein